MTHDCPVCGRRFGGTSAYDRHVDRRRDRCKSVADLRRLGIVANAAGVFVRSYHGVGRRARELEERDRGQLALGAVS